MTKEQAEYFRGVYDRQADRIYRISMIYLKNESDAEDALQSIFVKQIEKDKRFDDPEQEKAWYITVTKNYCKDVLKSSWSKHSSLYEMEEEPPAKEEDNDLKTDVANALNALPPVDREILYLYYYEGYKIKEIAKILNYRESTVGSKLVAARDRLKVKMEEDQNAR
ncbi:MAG: sigma-70 family RNA polymerase sigma factor [Lachnospiraceae bacterium]|nr:sigma-70 family RNA polymerase sigma factor [Lachnospiraceae bacterium]